MRYEGYTIVSDMDGTLLNSAGKLSKENKKAIETFVNEGGNFTVATGRMLPSVKRHIEDLKATIPVILYNGSKIYDFSTGEVLFEAFIEDYRKAVVKEIAKDNPSFGIEIYAEEGVYIYQRCFLTERFSKLGYEVYYEVTDEIFNKKWTKVLIIADEEALDSLESSYGECYEKGAIIRTGECYLEIVPNNISKGSALRYLCNRLNINKEKLITIGDNMNDLELLTVGKVGYCVENGAARLKNVAKKLAPSNNEHVMEFLLKEIG